MKRWLILIVGIIIVLSPTAIANTNDYEKHGQVFAQVFANNFQGGDPLSGNDFLYSLNGEVHNFIDEDYGYSWVGWYPDNSSDSIPEDSVNDGFTTMRGVQANADKETILQRYGYKWIKPYNSHQDALYNAFLNNEGDNDKTAAKLIDDCSCFVVYSYKTYDDTEYQIAFFFDQNDELTFVAYLYGKVYEDAGVLKTLQQGSKGLAVKDLQNRLAELGLYTIAVDGDYGNGTVKAVKAFEKTLGIEESGIATVELQELIYSDTKIDYHQTSIETGESNPTEVTAINHNISETDALFYANVLDTINSLKQIHANPDSIEILGAVAMNPLSSNTRTIVYISYIGLDNKEHTDYFWKDLNKPEIKAAFAKDCYTGHNGRMPIEQLDLAELAYYETYGDYVPQLSSRSVISVDK